MESCTEMPTNGNQLPITWNSVLSENKCTATPCYGNFSTEVEINGKCMLHKYNSALRNKLWEHPVFMGNSVLAYMAQHSVKERMQVSGK